MEHEPSQQEAEMQVRRPPARMPPAPIATARARCARSDRASLSHFAAADVAGAHGSTCHASRGEHCGAAAAAGGSAAGAPARPHAARALLDCPGAPGLARLAQACLLPLAPLPMSQEQHASPPTPAGASAAEQLLPEAAVQVRCPAAGPPARIAAARAPRRKTEPATCLSPLAASAAG
eukprot:5309844-Prymnesium_polylepis.1